MSRFTTEEVMSALISAPVAEQISILEGFVADTKIDEVADFLSLCLMTVSLEVDASCPADLRGRFDTLGRQVRKFNEARFGPAH